MMGEILFIPLEYHGIIYWQSVISEKGQFV